MHAKSILTHIATKMCHFAASSLNSPGGVYQKRVHHDCLVDKIEFQDLYFELKHKYKHWVSRWNASVRNEEDHCCGGGMTTDPQKHVFEDISICAFLICLWKGRREEVRFVDLGCGNGFLTHLLTQEHFIGYGRWRGGGDRSQLTLFVNSFNHHQEST